MKLLRNLSMAFALMLLSISVVYAQTTRKERQAKRQAQVKLIVDAQNYVFKANYVNPMRGIGRSLTSDYDLTVAKDTVTAFLPYFGRAYVAPTNPTEGGIKFTTTKFTYDSKPGKNGSYKITIKPTNKNMTDWRDVQTLYLTISADGYASLQVTSSNRDNISFNGTVESRDKK
jgi:hypothetical protein